MQADPQSSHVLSNIGRLAREPGWITPFEQMPYSAMLGKRFMKNFPPSFSFRCREGLHFTL